MNKFKFCFLIMMLFITSSLFALEGAFFGLGGDANGNTREGVAAGSVLTIGLDINRYFSLGFKKTYSFDFKDMTTIEDAGFIRFYPLEKIRIFLQAELGTSVLNEDNKSLPVLLGAFATGARFPLGSYFYLEPHVRGGYPFIWSAGLMAGASFSGDFRGDEKTQRTQRKEE